MSVFRRSSLRSHQPSSLTLYESVFNCPEFSRFFTNLISNLCCTCMLCSLPTVFTLPVLSSVTPCERTCRDGSATRKFAFSCPLRCVTSQQKPAIQDDEVGPLRGVMVSIRDTGGCGKSPGDRLDQPACQADSVHEMKLVNCL
jgi:hypothetical protein